MRKWLYVLLIILGILGILDTVLVLILISSVNTGVILPAVIGIFLIAYSTLKIRFKDKRYILVNTVLRRIVKGLFICGILLFIFIEVLIIHSAVDVYKPEDQAEYIIVLGCGIFPDGSLTLTLKNRLDKALEYMTVYDDIKVVVSGGKGYSEPEPEAYAMRDYLISMGIDRDKIIVEDKSSSTMENMEFSRMILEESDSKEIYKAAIVTSDFHLFRSKILAKRNGIIPYAIPCETPGYVKINCYLREFLAVIKSMLFDY